MVKDINIQRINSNKIRVVKKKELALYKNESNKILLFYLVKKGNQHYIKLCK